MARKTKKELAIEKAAIREDVIERVSLLCRFWQERGITAAHGDDALMDLYFSFCTGWGGRVIQTPWSTTWNPLSADNLAEKVAERLMASNPLPEEERFRQCEAVTHVWRSWEFMAKKNMTPGQAKGYCFMCTHTLGSIDSF